MAKKLSVDVREQATLGENVPPERDITDAVFTLVREASDFLHSKGMKQGALIVIGKFVTAGEVADARAGLRNDPFKGQYVSAGDKTFQRMILQGDVDEGAVVADESGQILAGGIMVKIDNWDIEVPAGGFMRHIAAASTSMRKDVKAAITLSEETGIARVFENGKVTREYNPEKPKAADEGVEAVAVPDAADVVIEKIADSGAPNAAGAEVADFEPPPKKRARKSSTTRKRKKKSARASTEKKPEPDAPSAPPAEQEPDDEPDESSSPAADEEATQ